MNRSHLVGWISAIFLLLSSFSVSAQDGEDRPVITPENADQLQQIAMIGCGHIYDMVISPNGQTIAIAGSAGVCFYDRTAGKSFIQTLNGHNGRAHSIAFSPDGHTLAVGGENNQIELWDIPSGEQTGQLDDLPTLVQKIVFNPDGTRLAYQSAYQYEDVIYIWNLETQSVEWSIQDYFLTLIGFAPDGTLLIVDERDLMSDPGNVQVRRVSVSGEITVVVLDDVIPRNENIWHYAGSADGRLIAGGSSKGTVRVWNTVTGELLAVFDAQASRVSAVAFSPDGSKLITLSGDNYDTTARLWDVASGHWETTVEDIDGNGAVFSPDGTTVFITTSDSMLHAWNIKTNEHAILASGHRAWHIGNVEHITFSTDGTQLLSDGQDGSRLWDVATGKEEDLAIKGYFSHVASLTLPGDSLWFSISDNISIGSHLWDELFPHSGRYTYQVVFNSNGTRFAVGDSAGLIQIWDIQITGETPTLEQQVILYTNPITCITWHPESTVIVSGHEDGTLRVWDVESYTTQHVWSGHSGAILDVAYNPNSTILATAGEDGLIQLWDAISFENITTLSGHEGAVQSIAWSPDASLLVSGGYDGTVRVWNSTTGEELAILEGHVRVETLYHEYPAVNDVAFNPAGTIIVSGGDDSAIRFWGVP